MQLFQTLSKIHVRFTEPGMHCWSGAHGKREYLSFPHRHLFHVEITMPVKHDDREVEFHDLRDEGVALFRSLGENGDLGGQSCEMMARAVGSHLAEKYAREVNVSVWEDGEFGATVSVAPR